MNCMEHRRRFPSIPNEVQIKFKSRKHFPRSAQTKSQGKSKLQNKKFPPQKVFYDGQIYDAFEQMKKFVRMAKKEQIVIDPYFADSVLPQNSRNKLLHAVDVAKFNAQYANTLTVMTSDKFHDRFLIIDKTTPIHVGASLNHLGKKCFAFSSLDKSNILDILAKL